MTTCRWRVLVWARRDEVRPPGRSVRVSPAGSINSEEESIMAIDVQPSVSPHLVVDDAAAAIDFYVKAFDATEFGRVPGHDGRSTTPTALGGTPVTIHLTVTDVDAKFQKAIDAGANVVAPLEDQFWGDRYGLLRDPFGHQWSLGQPVREVSMEELAEAMKQQQ